MVAAHRGELWTVAGGGRISSKPRPALVVQSDLFSGSDFVTVALVTSQVVVSPVRVDVTPSDTTGLSSHSQVMADKLQTVPRGALGTKIGAVSPTTMVDVERAILVYLDITS